MISWNHWLSSSNNNPKVIANYYLCCIKKLNLIPRVVRGDRGTENVIVCRIQRFLRRNHTDSQGKDKIFIYGHSAANQRIESWWSQLFKSMTSWWITSFKDMVVKGLFDISLNLYLQCLCFWFFGVLQYELDEIKSLWNSHRIRHIRNSNSPGGCTDVLCFIPEGSGVNDCKFSLDKSWRKSCNGLLWNSITIWMLGRVFRIIKYYHAREELNGPKNSWC